MSSKFFTWTKGDRRNASFEAYRSGGVDPIPVEHLPIKGMEHARTEKGKLNRKPLPLALDGSPTPPPKHSNRSSNSTAIHDAAMRSATSLLTAMTEVLRSPQMSAHLDTQSRSAGFLPPHGRQRSHTAPPTPLVEAPSTLPAELPGSLPGDQNRNPSRHDSVSDITHTVINRSSLGANIVRPHSSPQEPTYKPPNRERMSVESFYRDSTYQFSSRSQSTTPHQEPIDSACNNLANDKYSEKASDSVETVITRPSLSVLPYEPPKSSGLSGLILPSNPGSTHSVPQLGSFQRDRDSVIPENSQHADPEVLLMEQISKMRATHEAHLRSLKEAHDNEISSHRAYISFLENRHESTRGTKTCDINHDLTVDTSHFGTFSDELLSLKGSTSSMQSLESSSESHRDSLQGAAMGVEALKRKLSLSRKAQAEAGDVRRERDQLRDAVDRSDRRILQLKDIVRKAKEHEKALKNSNADLEARLVASNNERTDVLEGFHEACLQVRTISEHDRMLARELVELKAATCLQMEQKVPQLDAQAMLRARRKRTVSDVGTAPAKGSIFSQQLHDLQQLVREKNVRIKQLEQLGTTTSNQPKPPPSQDEASAKAENIEELESALKEYKRLLMSARADSDRYQSLLNHYLRRQIREGAEKSNGVGLQSETEAFATANEKSLRLEKYHSDISKNPEILEKELNYCIKEIVMYKMDVRSYRKDLKKASAQIESLRGSNTTQLPSTSGKVGTTSTASDQNDLARSTSSEQAPINSSGLGISALDHHTTPARSIASSTSTPFLSPTPPTTTSAMSSPPTRPRTPLGAHKKLPKPPSSATPPSSGLTSSYKIRVERSETLRSLSESIISSYAKRPPIDIDPYGIPPSVERNSEVLEPMGSSPPPLSKFALLQPMGEREQKNAT